MGVAAVTPDPRAQVAADLQNSVGCRHRRARIHGVPETSDDACYRAMDWLLDIAADLERALIAGLVPDATALPDAASAWRGRDRAPYGRDRDPTAAAIGCIPGTPACQPQGRSRPGYQYQLESVFSARRIG